MLSGVSANLICNCWHFSWCQIWVEKLKQPPHHSLLFEGFSLLTVHCVRGRGEGVRPVAAVGWSVFWVWFPSSSCGRCGKGTWCRWQLFSRPPGSSFVCLKSLPSILDCSALRHIFLFSCSCCSAPVLGLVSLAGGGLLWKAVGGVGGPRWV